MRNLLFFLILSLYLIENSDAQHRIVMHSFYMFDKGVIQGGTANISYTVQHIPDIDVIPAVITPRTGIFNLIFDVRSNPFFPFPPCQWGLAMNGELNPLVFCCTSTCRGDLNSNLFCLDPRLEFNKQRYLVTITSLVYNSVNYFTEENPFRILIDPGDYVVDDDNIIVDPEEEEHIQSSPIDGIEFDLHVVRPTNINIRISEDLVLFAGRIGVSENSSRVDFDLYHINENNQSVHSDQLLSLPESLECTNRDQDVRRYNRCDLNGSELFEIQATTSAFNYQLLEEETLPPIPYHEIQIKVNSDNLSNTIPTPQVIPVSYNASNKKSTYRLLLKYTDPHPEVSFIEENFSHNKYKSFTEYEVNVCEFLHCGARLGLKCCTDNMANSERLVDSKKFVVRTYRPLEWVKTNARNPCKENKDKNYWGTSSLYNSVLGSADQYGQISGDLLHRIGGLDYGIYTVRLCKDMISQPGYQETECDDCFDVRTINGDARTNTQFNFSYLPSGDYKLTIVNSQGCGVYEEFFTLSTFNTADLGLVIEDVPAFICPVPFGGSNTSQTTVKLFNTQGITLSSTKWFYECDLERAEVSSTDEITVHRGQGGLYALEILLPNGCKIKEKIPVIDLNLPPLQYSEIQNVIQNSASKFEHITSPVLPSISWNNIESINNFDRKNSYLSGKAGVYRNIQNFDYLDLRGKTTLANQNINIKSSGLYNNVSIFNWQHPGFLLCSPNWKLNNTITKFSISSAPLENKDILGLYSASLYGYKGLLPIAVSQLGRNHEVAYESFEEYEDDQLINQLSNSSGNFDLVNHIKPGDILYYEEYEISIGMSNYAIAKIDAYEVCPDDYFYADVISRSISNIPISCDGGKALEGEVPDVKILKIEDPCGIEDGVLLKFDSEGVPPFMEPMGKECKSWYGALRIKKYKSYPVEINRSEHVKITSNKAHTGKKSLWISKNSNGVQFENKDIRLEPDKEYLLSFWVSSDNMSGLNVHQLDLYNRNNKISVDIITDSYVASSNRFYPKGPAINGWQKIDAVFKTGTEGGYLTLNFDPKEDIYIDDVRFSPLNSGMQTYVYDPKTLRMSAVLDQNNYSTIYKYDSEGNLYLTLKETVEGLKTIQMNQSHISSNQ